MTDLLHNIIDDCREYTKDPAKWVDRYLNQCRYHKEEDMPKAKQRAKVIFEFHRGKGRQKFYWKAVSCNGRVICHSENMGNKAAPVNTVKNMIESIHLHQYAIKDYTAPTS